jgi:hypothetical protein
VVLSGTEARTQHTASGLAFVVILSDDFGHEEKNHSFEAVGLQRIVLVNG